MLNNLEGKKEICITRHFRDKNELSSSKFDCDLIPGQEKRAQLIAEKILKHCLDCKFKKISIFTSPKQRAIKTAKLIELNLLKNPHDIKIGFTEETSLRELDQGKLNLPKGFKDGDHFQPLVDAWTIFFKESFDNNNLLYKFGDPIITDFR